MEFASTNMAGCCALTGREIREIIQKFPDNHAFAGRPMKVRAPLECSFNVMLLLADGHQMPVSVHEDCLEDLLDNFPRLWANIMQAFDDEIELTSAQSVINPKTKAQLIERQKNMAKLVHNRPLGILAIERTLDHAKRERAARSH
ncbi:hypothetical protein KAR91_51900 [Candidatus Pacearchaeota archaeon]|nr:hypothetical protein [Candidatus Pacearchaeota archaeon]